MRVLIWMVLSVLLTAGCSRLYPEPYPDLVETEKPLVTACELVGVVSETADAGNPFAFDAAAGMTLRVRERALQLGATHIVWLHRTDISAAAEAFRCPPPP